jgi:hypothetical protein
VRFDLQALATIGPAVPLLQDLRPCDRPPHAQFDVTRDGQQILMLQVSRTVRPQIVVVQHWFAEVAAQFGAK